MVVIRQSVLSLILAFIVACVGVTTVGVGDAQAALVFHSGFESGNTFEWSSVTGSPSIQTTIKKTGSYAMRANTSSSSAYVNSGEFGGKRASFYLYIATAPSEESLIFGASSGASVRLTNDRYLKSYKSSTLLGTGATQLATMVWYRISTSVGALGWLAINGVREIENLDFGSYTYLEILGMVSPFTADLYFDDYVSDGVASSTDIGDIRTLLSLSSGDGTNVGFDTPSDSGPRPYYDLIDDAPGSISDTDYIQHAATATAKETNALQDSSTIGVGTGTVKAVRVLGRIKRGAGGAGGGKAIMVRDASTDTIGSALGPTTSYLWYFRYYATAPTSGTWTNSVFDALEAGVSHGLGSDDGQDTFISALMVMVAFTPATGPPAITVSPTSYSFGVVTESSTPSTTTTYFTIDNTSDIQTDQTISVTTSTWTGGVTWTHSDTATPGTDTAGLKANKGGTWGTGDVIVKFSTPNYIAENQAANTDYQFGLKLWAPTSFTDGVQKQVIVRITAAAG